MLKFISMFVICTRDEKNSLIVCLSDCVLVTRMHVSALRCVRSHSRSIWNMANLTPL